MMSCSSVMEQHGATIVRRCIWQLKTILQTSRLCSANTTSVLLKMRLFHCQLRLYNSVHPIWPWLINFKKINLPGNVTQLVQWSPFRRSSLGMNYVFTVTRPKINPSPTTPSASASGSAACKCFKPFVSIKKWSVQSSAHWPPNICSTVNDIAMELASCSYFFKWSHLTKSKQTHQTLQVLACQLSLYGLQPTQADLDPLGRIPCPASATSSASGALAATWKPAKQPLRKSHESQHNITRTASQAMNFHRSVRETNTHRTSTYYPVTPYQTNFCYTTLITLPF